MILSKPKFSTLFSLGAFLVIAYGLGIWTVLTLPDPPVPWWRYLIPGVTLLAAVLVTMKVFGGYRILRLNKDRWKITYKFLRKSKSFKTSEIEWWKVTVIDTKGGKYQELHIHSSTNINLKLSPQEHTEYQKVLSYVQRNCPKKRIKTH